MKKSEFLQELRRSRINNIESSLGNLKTHYSEDDDELAWRLFQSFPGKWSDEQRYQGLCVLIPHMTLFTWVALQKGLSLQDIAKALHFELKEKLFFHFSFKYLKLFVSAVKRTIIFNKP